MQPRAIDLFAGCGGLSYGLSQAGFDVVFASEIDTSAADTYALNHSNTHLHRGDIRTISEDTWHKFAGSIDLLAGGPPCQGFSIAGRRQFGEIPEQNTLVEQFIHVASLVKPRMILMENVAGFRTAQIRPNIKALPFTVSRLESLGYHVSVQTLQAVDFGVPSYRSRLFIVASKHGFVHHPFPEPTHGMLNAQRLTCLDAISDLPLLGAGEGQEGRVGYASAPLNSYQAEARLGSLGVTNHVAMKHTPRLVERFSQLRPGESAYRSSMGKTTVYKSNNQRLVGTMPSLCITANFQSNYVHPLASRNLTAREAARLMSYPDSFHFLGKRTLMSRKFLEKYGRAHEAGLSQYNQIGNSVPPRLAKAFGRVLIRALDNRNEIAA